MLYSRGITAEGMIERSALEHLGIALPYFGRQFLGAFTIAILIPALAGLVRAVKNPTPFWAVCASLPVAMVAFYSLIPAGLEPRYLLPVIPSILFLGAHGLSWIPDPKKAALAGGIAFIAFLALGGFSVRQKDFSGFEPAAEALLDDEAEHILVSSDPRGEGAFIAEVAMRDPDRPSHTVSRASKVLSTSDWLGRGYALTYATDAELKAFIDETDFDGVVIDRAVPEVFQTEHHDQIARVMAGENNATSVAERPRREDGEIRFYKDPMR
jgi:hypothetical protein